MAVTESKIRKAYMTHIMEHGNEPASIYAFAKSLKMAEKEFYDHFNSFEQIEKAIWKAYFVETLEQIQKEEVYSGYSIREKLLAFHYTLIEALKEDRSFLLKSYQKMAKPIASKTPKILDGAKSAFLAYAGELMMEGRETREVENRPVPQIMQRYPDMIWMATKSVIDFWMTDESKSFEKSDTMIEKVVNTMMDWIGKSPLDSLFDLGKFMYQNGKGLAMK
ncbi:DNA-binding transcriptional regulator, AcrR family [Spirosomataceae bacterium TFI 002]|nr:DNA-binding transcriptional regulator, AcrR family [Spirosomataceae bacterium TFI 002]